MKLIIGGSSQGKLAYALTLAGGPEAAVADGAFCPWEEVLQKPIVNHLHLLVKRCLQAAKDPELLLAEMLQANPELVLICDEVGCGLVPVDPAERAWREAAGRLCCKLAQQAGQVVRVYCGLPTIIKGVKQC